jgi:hypothetical protein
MAKAGIAVHQKQLIAKITIPEAYYYHFLRISKKMELFIAAL